MLTRYVLPCIVFVFTGGILGSHLDPECPRHRGLPDGFVQAENRFRDRAHFRLDLRSALKGYVPNEVYRFRVQTTVRKHKFDDATVVIDALDANCGTGSWVIESDLLYSPKGCPSVVTTQQKQQMGRAYFIWRAPSCGCVHIRVRVHANSMYYIEDEDVHNGPLARTICPKPGTVVEPIHTTTTIVPHHTQVPLSRDERLDLLCDVTKAHGHNDVMQYEYFMTRRRISKLNHFEMDRLSMAVQRRHLDVLSCCNKNDSKASMECFGDIRRNSIDSFCGTGEPDIPFAKETYDWIKQKENECCPQIGEQRYRCFNQTLHNTAMMRDGHEKYSHEEQDDFDPINFIQDYPAAGDMREEFIAKKTNPTTTLSLRHKLSDESNYNTEEKNNTVNENVNVDQLDNDRTIKDDVNGDKASVVKDKKKRKDEDAITRRQDNTNVRKSHDEDKKHVNEDDVDVIYDEAEEDNDKEDESSLDKDEDDNDDGDDHMDDKAGEDDDKEDESSLDKDEDDDNDDGDDHIDEKRVLSNDEESVRRDSGRERVMSIEECCMNGIDVGTKIASMGFDGCFKMANKFNEYFKNWHRKCDLHFVVCCMRVIDGGKREEETIKLFKIYKFVNSIRKHKYACVMKHFNTTRKFSLDSNGFIRKRAKLKHLSTKLVKLKKHNLTLKSKVDTKALSGPSKIFKDTSNYSKDHVFRNKQRVRHISKNYLPKREKELKYQKWKRKMMSYRKQNSVLKTLNSSKGGPAMDLE